MSAVVTMAEPSALEQSTIRKITRRLIPFLVLLYVVNFLDRTNVGFAALRMCRDIGMSPAMYGLGAGIFFIGYFIFEVPSNIALHRVGARRWIARIMISWGIVAMLMAFLQSVAHFVTLRVLLGVAEAGFYPGIIYFLSLWFPAKYRAGVCATFYLGVPISQVVGAPLSTALMEWGDAMGLVGWRAMYFIEGLPAVVLGVVTWFYLTDRPAQATWLSSEERQWLAATLDAEERLKPSKPSVGLWSQVRQTIGNRFVLALSLVYFGITVGSNAMNFFLPSVLQSLGTHLGRPQQLMTTGLLTAIPYAVAAIAMVLWSRHSDQTRERRFHAGGAAVIAAIAIALAFLVNDPILIQLGFIVMAAGIYSAINVFWSVPSQVLTGVGAAAGIGLINSIGNLSGFLGPYLTGGLYGLTGSYVPAFLLIAALVFAAGVGFIVLMRPSGN